MSDESTRKHLEKWAKAVTDGPGERDPDTKFGWEVILEESFIWNPRPMKQDIETAEKEGNIVVTRLVPADFGGAEVLKNLSPEEISSKRAEILGWEILEYKSSHFVCYIDFLTPELSQEEARKEYISRWYPKSISGFGEVVDSPVPMTIKYKDSESNK